MDISQSNIEIKNSSRKKSKIIQNLSVRSITLMQKNQTQIETNLQKNGKVKSPRLFNSQNSNPMRQSCFFQSFTPKRLITNQKSVEFEQKNEFKSNVSSHDF